MLSQNDVLVTSKPSLLVLDFDHTVVDDNTDTYIWKLGENGGVPDSITGARGQKLWTYLMQDVFDYLHQLGRSSKDILDWIACMKLAPGMGKLLSNIPKHCDVIIISDSNTVFIQQILETQGLAKRISHVYTNPARFDQDGRLLVTPYTNQDACGICERNLCKGDALKSHMERMANEGKRYERVVYVGDGMNDHCPCLRLSDRDVVFARSGYKLEKQLKKAMQEGKVRAEVFTWTDASIVLQRL